MGTMPSTPRAPSRSQAGPCAVGPGAGPSSPGLWGPWAEAGGLAASASGPPPPPQIIHTDSNTVLGQNDTGFSCDGSASTFRVMFKEPVEVLPNVNYTACATLKVCLTQP